MDSIIFRKKPYQVLEQLGEQTYKVSYKDKVFVLKTFTPDSLEFSTFLRKHKRLKISGVNIPKLIKVDKKSEMALLEYVEGQSMFDILKDMDLPEDYYKLIFEQAWYAEAEKITLDYHPDNFILDEKGHLHYIKIDYIDGVDETKNFKTTYIKYWFFTKEFVNYAKSKGINVDLRRLKDEYKTNKEIVLMVVKYYF